MSAVEDKGVGYIHCRAVLGLKKGKKRIIEVNNEQTALETSIRETLEIEMHKENLKLPLEELKQQKEINEALLKIYKEVLMETIHKRTGQKIRDVKAINNIVT